MKCNLNQRGRRIRLFWGVGCGLAAAGLAIALCGGWLGGWGWWVAVAALAVNAILGYFEYRRGWCVMRAMGLKTPI